MKISSLQSLFQMSFAQFIQIDLVNNIRLNYSRKLRSSTCSLHLKYGEFYIASQ